LPNVMYPCHSFASTTDKIGQLIWDEDVRGTPRGDLHLQSLAGRFGVASRCTRDGWQSQSRLRRRGLAARDRAIDDYPHIGR
jgi:hypothetical protein